MVYEGNAASVVSPITKQQVITMVDTKTSLWGTDPNAPNVLILNNEEDAWELLANLRDDNYRPPDDILFGDWINLEICLQGEKWNSTITPSIFPVFETLQTVIYRAYAEAKYGNKKKRLTKEEREFLEIIIKVREGSSIFETISNLKEIAIEGAKNMESKHILIGILTIALLYGGTTAYRYHLEYVKSIRVAELENEEKKAALESLKIAGEQEIARMKIMQDIVNNNKLAQTVYEDSEELHNSMLRSSTKAENSIVDGVELDQETALELTKSKRVKPEPLQINGHFHVMKLEWHTSTLAEITFRRVEDAMIVKATLDLAWFDDTHKEIIKNAEWDEKNPKIIKANINARISKDGKVTNAELVKVEAVSGEYYNDIETAVGSE